MTSLRLKQVMLVSVSILTSALQSPVYAAGSDNFSAEVAYSASRGNYGTANLSREEVTSTSLTYDVDQYSVSLMVPYVHQIGPAGAVAGRPGLQRRNQRRARRLGSAPTRMVSESGMGDVQATVTRYLVDDVSLGLSLSVSGSIKFATADQSKGLGTGERDYSVALDLSKTFGVFTASGSLGYSVLGSPGNVVVNGARQNLEFKNIFYGSLDGAFKFAEKASVGATVNMSQASSEGAEAPRDVSLYVSFAPSNSFKIRAYGMKGLSDGSPDSGGGASATLFF